MNRGRGAAARRGRPPAGTGRARDWLPPDYAVTCGWRETSTISCGSVTIVSMIP